MKTWMDVEWIELCKVDPYCRFIEQKCEQSCNKRRKRYETRMKIVKQFQRKSNATFYTPVVKFR
jgi:hypothetical protein